jgi:hypothetical protein
VCIAAGGAEFNATNLLLSEVREWPVHKVRVSLTLPARSGPAGVVLGRACLQASDPAPSGS